MLAADTVVNTSPFFFYLLKKWRSHGKISSLDGIDGGFMARKKEAAGDDYYILFRDILYPPDDNFSQTFVWSHVGILSDSQAKKIQDSFDCVEREKFEGELVCLLGLLCNPDLFENEISISKMSRSFVELISSTTLRDIWRRYGFIETNMLWRMAAVWFNEQQNGKFVTSEIEYSEYRPSPEEAEEKFKSVLDSQEYFLALTERQMNVLDKCVNTINNIRECHGCADRNIENRYAEVVVRLKTQRAEANTKKAEANLKRVATESQRKSSMAVAVELKRMAAESQRESFEAIGKENIDVLCPDFPQTKVADVQAVPSVINENLTTSTAESGKLPVTPHAASTANPNPVPKKTTTGMESANDAQANTEPAIATSINRSDARKKYDSLPNEGKRAMKQNAALHACKKENLHMDIEDIGILFGLPEKSLNREPYKSIIKRGRDKARQESRR